MEEWPTELLLLNVGGRAVTGSLAEYLQILRRDVVVSICLLYTSPSPRDGLLSRMPSSA